MSSCALCKTKEQQRRQDLGLTMNLKRASAQDPGFMRKISLFII